MGSAPYLQWIQICLMAARRAILKKWLSPAIPTNADIKMELKTLLDKKKLDIKLFHNTSKTCYTFRWQAFIDSNLSPLEETLLHNYFCYDHDLAHLPRIFISDWLEYWFIFNFNLVVKFTLPHPFSSGIQKLTLNPLPVFFLYYIYEFILFIVFSSIDSYSNWSWLAPFVVCLSNPMVALL